jgi:hypothetical protein
MAQTGYRNVIPTISRGKNSTEFGAFPSNIAIRAVTQGGITGIPAGPLSLAS